LTILPAERAATNFWREVARRGAPAAIAGDVLLRNVPVIDQDGGLYCRPAVRTEIGPYMFFEPK